MENNTNVFAKYPAVKIVLGLAVLAALYFGVSYLRDSGRLGGVNSDASCYGYQCEPFVMLGARPVTPGYTGNSFSYGRLAVTKGTVIEFTWTAANVNRCVADWSKFRGTYMQPTVYGKISSPQQFEVTCFRGRTSVRGVIDIGIVRN